MIIDFIFNYNSKKTLSRVDWILPKITKKKNIENIEQFSYCIVYVTFYEKFIYTYIVY